MPEQLPLLARTRCGYCATPLEPRAIGPRTVYECPACGPELRGIKTTAEWAAWTRRMARLHPDRGGKRSPARLA